MEKAQKQRLLDSAKEAEGSIEAPFFEIFGTEISDVEIIKNDRDVVLRLFEPIIRLQNLPGIKWLSDLLTNNPNLLEGYDPEFAINEFSARVEEVSKREISDDMKTYLQLIITTLVSR